MKGPRKRTMVIAIALLALAALAVGFIHLPAGRISAAMSRALGRSVNVSSAGVRLLPTPAIELHYVTIGEDPAFGAEPMMTAPIVIATLRVTSLLRGRLEFGSISFQDSDGVSPSFNLVRRTDGQWNVESLMWRAGATPAAPTALKNAEPKPHFPYIEVTSGRLNFKAGNEKKVVALTEADFALWLESDNEWRARLKARPMRADANLSDTGKVDAEASIHRGLAPASGTAMIDIEARLRDSQLGQLSALIYGRDRGWRGASNAELTIIGPLAEPVVQLHAVVEDFRRYDIVPSQSLRIEAACQGQVVPKHEAIESLHCTVPYGDGHIEMTGSVSGLAERSFELSLEVDRVPVSRVLALARRAKDNLPADLIAEGELNARLTASRSSRHEAATWSGRGELRNLTLDAGKSAIRVAVVNLAAGSDARRARGFLIAVEPFALAMGAERPATVSAQFDAAGYGLSVTGPVAIEQALQSAHLLGMPAPSYDAHGSANLQLTIAGAWAGFAQPIVTGSAQITNASAEIAGLAVPLRVNSAQLELNGDTAVLRNFSASLGVKGPSFSGTIELARGCAHPESCDARFNLHTSEVDLSELSRVLSKQPQQPWYRLFASTQPQPKFLLRARAQVHVSVGRLLTAVGTADNVEAEATLQNGLLHLTNIHGQVLGGKHSGEWTADFTGNEPRYSGEGKIERAAMKQAATVMRNTCCSGTVDLGYSISFAGKASAELLRSAAGDADFTWHNGALNQVLLASAHKTAKPLRFTEFRGHLALHDGQFELTRSKMATQNGIYQVSGRISLDRRLALTLASATERYAISGKLDAPEVGPEVQRAATPASTAPQAPAPTPVANKSAPPGN